MRRIILVASFLCHLCCTHKVNSNDLEASIYRQEMRRFVKKISAYAKGMNANFLVIPQNAEDIVTAAGNPKEPLDYSYLKAIDGIGRESLFYGYGEDNVVTPGRTNRRIMAFLDKYLDNGLHVLVTDYAFSPNKLADSYLKNDKKNYISFGASRRGLDNIPSYPGSPFRENREDIHSLANVRNFLYLLDAGNPDFFTGRENFLAAMRATNFDALIIDAFYEGEILTASEVHDLRTKQNGGSRLVIAYMSIGEAENYRYYWQAGWDSAPPSWLDSQNPTFQDNFLVRYWQPEWQEIICHGENSYLQRIIEAGFDGVYLDVVDAFEQYESR